MTPAGPEEVLRAMLDAGARGDVAAVESLVSPDLVLYKVGHVRRLPDMLAAIRDFSARRGRGSYELTDMTVRVSGDLAVLHFRSRGVFNMPGEPERSGQWLESVTLQRTDSWRIVFYHSTTEAGAP